MNADGEDLRDLYLGLLERVLTRSAFPERYRPIVAPSSSTKDRLARTVQGILRRRDFELVRRVAVEPMVRARGGDWPAEAETMIGLQRLRNIRSCVETVLDDEIPGDLVETGVWRGGASIYMRAVLQAHGVSDRTVWAADSFEGLPPPSGGYPADAGSRLFEDPTLAVSLEEVKGNFERYELLDDQVRFLKGWFKDTLPTAPITRIAVLRLDGDLYESTMDALRCLFPKVPVGGFVIVDDYRSNETCRLAVEDFLAEDGTAPVLLDVDLDAVYWRRS